MRVQRSMNSGIWANSAALSGSARIGSIPNQPRRARGIFPLMAQLVTPLRHRYRMVLLVPELGAGFADQQKRPLAFLVAKQPDPFPLEGMRMAGQLALGHDQLIALGLHSSGGGRDPLDGAQQHITLSVLPWHRGFLLQLMGVRSHAPASSSALTSFKEARISQSGLRRANSAANAQRSIPYFLLKASAPIRCCSSWWMRQRLIPKMSCGV